ncbi:MAG: hypothetical protein K6T85_12385 [Gorillibacterium sp.]|nr:hypothetical protein [Gorillibacterium sp.]
MPPKVQAHTENQASVIFKQEKEIFEDGKIVGTLHRTITRTFLDDKKAELKTIDIKQYDSGKTIEESKSDIIEVKSENEVYVNGNKVDASQAIYAKPVISENLANPLSPPMVILNSGGLYTFTTYENRYLPGVGYSTLMSSASGVKNRLTTPEALFLDWGGAKDDEITKVINTSLYQSTIINYSYYADTVKSYRTVIAQNTAFLVTSLGVAVITAATVWGLLLGAGSAVAFAVAIYNASGDAGTAMNAAYSLLKTMN